MFRTLSLIQIKRRNCFCLSTGLRLIASTITSFLILALLLFMIHRLRQRRLLLMIRRNTFITFKHLFVRKSIEIQILFKGLQTRRLEQVNGLANDNPNMGYLSAHEQYDFTGSFNEPPPPYTFWKPPEHFIPPGEAPPPYDDSFGVTVGSVVPCFEVSHQPINRVNITGNCILGSPTPFQQSQMISRGVQPTLCSGGQTLMTSGISSMAPIIDTISSDNCYEHITVVRINDSQNNSNLANDFAGCDVADSVVVQNNNTFSDSTSTSSIASSESTSEALNSPSNCSMISSSSQSTSTQSTVRRLECDTISRLWLHCQFSSVHNPLMCLCGISDYSGGPMSPKSVWSLF